MRQASLSNAGYITTRRDFSTANLNNTWCVVIQHVNWNLVLEWKVINSQRDQKTVW